MLIQIVFLDKEHNGLIKLGLIFYLKCLAKRDSIITIIDSVIK